MKTLTVFTPTFNRKRTLSRLYKSLLSQSSNDFVWLVVDDGSTDSTDQLISSWIEEKHIDIQYFRQNNMGKAAAHNKAAELCETELFFCVDSDDYLPSNAIKDIIDNWVTIREDEFLIGIVGYKADKENKLITTLKDLKVNSFKLKEGYDRYGLRGDTALVFRTEILKHVEFPQFFGEKFVPEAYLYDKIDGFGELYILRKIICNCEYQSEGYSQNIAKVLYDNPNGYFAFIVNRLLYNDNDFYSVFLDSARYIAMSIAHRHRFLVVNSPYPMISFLAFPVGVALYFMRYRGCRK